MAIENTDLAREVSTATGVVSDTDLLADERAYAEIRGVVAAARQRVETTVNSEMVAAYWHVGRQISERIGQRAAYGKHLYRYLSEQLTAEFGRGFGPSNLSRMRQFYEAFPIFATLSQRLSWSHYLQIMRTDGKASLFYMREAEAGGWSVRDLKRAIDTKYYERLLHTQEAGVFDCSSDAEDGQLARGVSDGARLEGTDARANVLKDPYVFDFLDIGRERDVLESELESMLIDGLQDFLLELGHGFAYVGRQQRVSDGGEDYSIDLVFYNYFLKCFVLIDLKTHPLTAQDAGQMDFYMSLFDDQCRVPGDNPSIGIVMCTSKTETIAKYSVLARNENLYAAQYFSYLPTEEELEAVLRRNRAEFEQRVIGELSAGGEAGDAQ